MRAIFENILVCGSPLHDAPILLKQALSIAHSGVGVRLLELPEAPRPLPARRAEPLERIVESLSRQGISLRREKAAETSGQAIVEEVLAGHHDLVIKGVARENADRRTLDGADLALVRRCPCPVWFVECLEIRPPRRILAALDPAVDDDRRRHLAIRVATLAAELASATGAELHVLHAWVAFGDHLLRSRVADEELQAYIRAARECAMRASQETLSAAGVELSSDSVHFVKGDLDHVLPRLVAGRDIDLLVMGTKGRSGWLESVIRPRAETALCRTRVSVLLTKAR
jgi:universal stress protein E